MLEKERFLAIKKLARDIREDNNIKWNDDELKKQYEELMNQLIKAASSSGTNTTN